VSEPRATLEEWTDAIVRSDSAAAGAVLAEDFVLTSAGGVAPHMPRQAWLAALSHIETRSLTCDVIDERVFGDVAVVASRLVWDAQLGDRNLSGEYAVTDVLTRHEDRWRVSRRVSTRLIEGK